MFVNKLCREVKRGPVFALAPLRLHQPASAPQNKTSLHRRHKPSSGLKGLQCRTGLTASCLASGRQKLSRARRSRRLLHCSVTVTLFSYLTCMSFALCISAVVHSEPPLPSLAPVSSFLDILDSCWYFLLFGFRCFFVFPLRISVRPASPCN